MSGAPTELRLGVAAKAENLALVRQALAGLADALDLDEAPLADLKQIATEGCMNAVVHAYPDGELGRMEVVAREDDDHVELRIRDWGTGFRPRPAESDDASLRLGLPLIASIAESFQIASHGDGGTEVMARVRKVEPEAPSPQEPPAAPDEAELEITAGESVKPVLARVIAVAATRAGFSLDRMSDGVLLGDAIASHSADDFDGHRVGLEIEDAGPNLCVRVGPFVAGGGQRLIDRLELPGLGVSLSKLASRVAVESRDDLEHVVLEIEP